MSIKKSKKRANRGQDSSLNTSQRQKVESRSSKSSDRSTFSRESSVSKSDVNTSKFSKGMNIDSKTSSINVAGTFSSAVRAVERRGSQNPDPTGFSPGFGKKSKSPKVLNKDLLAQYEAEDKKNAEKLFIELDKEYG